MNRANTYKALIGFTIIFMLLAAVSFAAFRETNEFCGEAKTCTEQAPVKRGGEMLWDSFSRRFISLVALP
jgi:hypothetical protein